MEEVKNCSTCKNNIEYPTPHTCDICKSLDEDKFCMWESKTNTIIQELVDIGIAKCVDGLSSSRSKIIKLVSKDTLSPDEKIDLQFEIDVFLSCIN